MYNELLYQLDTLLRIPSPSGRERGVVNYCALVLRNAGFVVDIDPWGNISAVRGRGPYILLNAHMDSVGENQIGPIIYDEEKQIFRKRKAKGDIGVLGGDDKAGIAIILSIAKQTTLPMKVLLTVMEEPPHMSRGIGHFVLDSGGYLFFDDVVFTVVLDRGGMREIIPCYRFTTSVPMVGSIPGTKNPLCASDAMVDLIRAISAEVGSPFKRAVGSACDMGVILYFSPSVNLSVGYFNPHSRDEYVVPGYTFEALRLAAAIINNRDAFGLLHPEWMSRRVNKIHKSSIIERKKSLDSRKNTNRLEAAATEFIFNIDPFGDKFNNLIENYPKATNSDKVKATSAVYRTKKLWDEIIPHMLTRSPLTPDQ